MPRLRNIQFKFLRNHIQLSKESFSQKDIYNKLQELGEDKNPNFLSGNENDLTISTIANGNVFKQLFQSFKEFIRLKSPIQPK